MKTILHVLNTGSYSGAENVVITMIKQLEAAYPGEYRFIYASRLGPIEKRIKQEGIQFVPIRKMSVTTIRRIVKQYQVDLVHAHDFNASMICGVALLKVPIVSHLHNNPLFLQVYGLKSVAYYLTSFRYKRILTVSPAIQKEYVFGNRLEKKIVDVGNPISINAIRERVKSSVGKTNDISFLGRLSPQKNPLRFIGLVSRLTECFPDLSVVMIGDGELREECEAKIKDLRLNRTIRLAGFMDNPYPLLKQGKLLCVTSDWEGFGLMAVEALALGVPVVSTYIGGLKGIITQDCGVFCDTDDEFVKAISRLLTDEEFYRHQSEKALKRAEEMDNIVRYGKQIHELYDKVVEKGKKQ